jgi:hypothetical protein
VSCQSAGQLPDALDSGYPVLSGYHLISGAELTGGRPKNDDDLNRGRSDSFLSVKAAERIAEAPTDEAPQPSRQRTRRKP